jgi:hypothetical protein
MKRHTALAGALASVVMVLQVGVASADVRIAGDRGGAVSAYIGKYQAMRATGERIVIDGPCLSSCTLFAGIVPPNQVCVTKRATLGFHAASIYNDASSAMMPTTAGTSMVMGYYPPAIRSWINRHGGLTRRMRTMSGRELASLYRPC